MISEKQLSALLGIAVFVWGIVLILNGTSVNINYLKPFSTVLGVLTVCLGIFDKWAWCLPLLYPWFVSTPNIQGTWKGQINSSWKNPDTSKKAEAIEVYLVIHQTFSKINLKLISAESSSDLLVGNILSDTEGRKKIIGTYNNTPRILLRDRSPIHYGSLILDIHGNPPKTLDGFYWTDRETKGELIFNIKIKRIIYNYEEAQKAFQDFSKADENVNKTFST